MKLGSKVMVVEATDGGPIAKGTVIGSATWLEPMNCGTHVLPGTPGYADMEHGYLVQPDSYPKHEIMVVHPDNLRVIGF